MKEQLYTIPVTEAFQSECDCPLCAVHDKLDKDATDYSMGPSYMEGDIRMETNKVGFCKYHYDKMYHMKNRLGLALMCDTHIQEIIKQLEAKSDTLKEGKKGFFSKGSKEKPEVLSFLTNIADNCYICNKINSNFDRYLDTIFYLWEKEPSFKELVNKSKGFCFEHFTLLLDKGKENLSKEGYASLVDAVVPKELDLLKALEKDVAWFIDKNDYRHKNDPWGTAKDSVERAVKLLSALKVDEE
ncbi:MAG: DUF6062 family protein [Clostridiales bacterium]|nr:DUF6062 family protein [Clostridiales bacterium]